MVMASALSVLVYGVMLATDGEMASTSQKVGRLAVLAPAMGGLAALLAKAQAGLRGETRALAALGVHPSRACLGALMALGLVGLVGAVVIGLGAGDISGLFPRLPGGVWLPWGDGGWAMAEAGVKISSTGEPMLTGADDLPPAIGPCRAAVAACIVSTTAALTDWVREPLGSWERIAAVTVAGLGTIVLFHAVAAERLPAWSLGVAPVPLVVHAWARRGWRILQKR